MIDANDIYSYDDYREYLRDWYWLSKESNETLSFRAVSKQLGLKAPNHFHLVISKKRHLSLQTFSKVKKMLALDEATEQYFEILFRACTATVAVEQKQQQRLMVALRKSHTADGQSPHISINSIAWYIKTSAYLFSDKTVPDICDIITKYGQFAISGEKVEQALALLKHQGVMQLGDDDCCQFSQDFDRPDSEAITAHHRESLNIAMLATALPQQQRFFSSVTIPADPVLYQSIVEDIRNSCVSWLEQANERAATLGSYDRIMTLQLALFPFLQWQTADGPHLSSAQSPTTKEQSPTIS